jgi:hypothetical protein
MDQAVGGYGSSRPRISWVGSRALALLLSDPPFGGLAGIKCGRCMSYVKAGQDFQYCWETATG